jgi:hypothetical protein
MRDPNTPRARATARRATQIAILALAASAPASHAATHKGPERGARAPIASSRAATIQILRFDATLVQSKLLDLDDVGFGLGDQSVFADELRTTPGGRSAGFDGGVCTVVRVDDAVSGSGILQCVVTTSLKGGTVTTQGLSVVKNLAPAGMEIAAITGGTGRFQFARGQALITFVSAGKAIVEMAITT